MNRASNLRTLGPGILLLFLLASAALAANTPPTVGTPSPSSGILPTGQWTTMTCTYTDLNGRANLATGALLINNVVANVGGAHFIFNRNLNKFYMKNNANAVIGGVTRGTATTIQSENAILDCAGTTIAVSANSMTISWRFQIKPAMAGKTCNLYVYAADNSGGVYPWTAKGQVFINAAPTVGTLSPNSGVLPTYWTTITCTYTDADGRGNLATCCLLINNVIANNGGAQFIFNRNENKFYMKNNANLVIGGVTRGTATTIQSENAILDCAGTTISTSTNDITIRWRFQIKPTMAGKTCNLYVSAADNSGGVYPWTAKGQVFMNTAPTVGPVSPDSGSIPTDQWTTMTCTYTDVNGRSNLATGALLINNVVANAGGAHFIFNRNLNKFYMKNNANAVIGGVTRGTATTIQSENAILDCAGTTITVSANGITISWRFQIKTTMAGKICNLYVYASDNSGGVFPWTAKGTVTIAGGSPDVCEMVYIPAGSFLMGNNGSEPYSWGDELPQHSVYLSEYWIGKYEVTRGEYRQFIDAGGYSNPAYWSAKGWTWKVSNSRTEPYYWAASQNWGTGTFTQTDNHPVAGVTYYEAEAFCNWAGGHPPTEAQWEKAARWTGSAARTYPWGDTWDQERSNNYYDSLYTGDQTAPVGSYPSGGGPYGLHDMAGNVREWCRDWWRSSYSQTPTGGWVNPTGPGSGTARVVRGGGWGSDGDVCRCAYRDSRLPSNDPSVGFRFCRSELVSHPGAPCGNTNPMVDVTYEYSSSGSTCSQGHPVEYSFDWGDGASSPWSTSTSALHSWSALGTRIITVTARCQVNTSFTATSTQRVVTVIDSLPHTGEMVYIPAGSFPMGNNGSEPYSSPWELPQHSVYLSGYWIGKYEVTRGEYRAFMDAGGYSDPAYWSTEGWAWKVDHSRTEPEYWPAEQDWFGGCPFTQTDDHPVVGVTYYEAEAYCNWAGSHLPTEAQWEKAARWTGTHPNVYPWGDVWDAEKCNNWYNLLYSGYRTVPVGSYPSGVSPYGCHDMAGNVEELCKDWFQSDYYSETPSGGWSDPGGPASGNSAALRGGSYNFSGSVDAICRCAHRSYGPYAFEDSYLVGFRLAH